MKRNINYVLGLLLVLASLSSCSVHSHLSATADYQMANPVNRKPSGLLNQYDSSLATSWNMTYSRCVQVKAAIDKEIDQRERRQARVGKIFAAIGGAAGIASSVDVIATRNPSPITIGILGIFSGTAFAASLGFVKEDQILAELKEQSQSLQTLKEVAEIQLTELERLIALKNLLVKSGKNDLMRTKTDPMPDPDVIDMEKKIQEQITAFRTALRNWDNATK